MGKGTELFTTIGSIIVSAIIIDKIVKKREQVKSEKVQNIEKRIKANLNRIETNLSPAGNYYSETKAEGICYNTGCNNLATHFNGQCEEHYFDDDD